MAMPMERLALTSSAFHVTTTNLKKVSHTLIIRHPNLVTRDHLWPFKNVNLLSVWGKESGLVCQAVKQRLPFLLHHQPTLPLLRRISVYSLFFLFDRGIGAGVGILSGWKKPRVLPTAQASSTPRPNHIRVQVFGPLLGKHHATFCYSRANLHLFWGKGLNHGRSRLHDHYHRLKFKGISSIEQQPFSFILAHKSIVYFAFGLSGGHQDLCLDESETTLFYPVAGKGWVVLKSVLVPKPSRISIKNFL